MTTVYFIRHAEPDFTNHNDAERPLTEKGRFDRALVTAFLWDKQIDKVLSSPFKRAHDTVADFTERKGLEVEIVDDFRERAVCSEWVIPFEDFTRSQWNDFNYKLPGGESLHETQFRNIAALKRTLAAYPNQNVVVGSHGTALCTILRHFDETFGYDGFCDMKRKFPWVVKFTFDGEVDNFICKNIQTYDVAVRPMTIHDYENVSALWSATEGLGKTAADDSPEAVNRFLERNPGFSMVADIGGVIAGALLCGHDGRRAGIYHAAVLSGYRGMGLGKAMLHAVYSALRQADVRKVSITVFNTNTSGDAFWDAKGFIRRDDLIFRNRTVPGME